MASETDIYRIALEQIASVKKFEAPVELGAVALFGLCSSMRKVAITALQEGERMNTQLLEAPYIDGVRND